MRYIFKKKSIAINWDLLGPVLKWIVDKRMENWFELPHVLPNLPNTIYQNDNLSNSQNAFFDIFLDICEINTPTHSNQNQTHFEWIGRRPSVS